MASVAQRARVLYFATLAGTSAVQVWAWTVLVLVVLGARQSAASAHLYLVGSLLAIMIGVAFAMIKRALKRASPEEVLPKEARGSGRYGLIALACVTVASIIVSANLGRLAFGEGASRRVFVEGGSYYYFAEGGGRHLATLADYALAQTLMAMVPVVVAIFLSGVLQLFVCADWVAPGYPLKVVFAPWRIGARKKSAERTFDMWWSDV